MDLGTFYVPLKILKTFGIWITNESSMLYILYAIVMQMFFVYMFTFMMGMYFVKVSDVIDFADQSSSFCTYLVCSVKCVNYFFQCDAIEVLFKELQQCMDHFGTAQSYKKHVDKAFFFVKVYWSATFFTVFMAGFLPFFSNRLAYRQWFPYDLNVPILYYISALYQWIGTLCYSACNVMMDMIPVLLMGYYISMLEHLADKMKHFTEKSLKSTSNNELITCVRYQLKIIEFVRKTEKIFSVVIFIQGLFSSVILCTTSFALTMLVWPTDAAWMIKFISYMLAMIVQIFIPCYYGTELRLTYDKVADSLFHSEWIQEDCNFRSNVGIIMENSKTSMKIVAFGNINIDLNNFGTICNSAYSLFSVFKRIR